mmetsp:Transcript_24391/g.72721  ORF Transcript_24391/g.72721 Transcript_24391/m.72721 type:complete len:367 (+) Transcript_24391:200-1300(+)
MWLFGVLVCTAGSFLLSLGLVLQKYSHLKERGWGGSAYCQPWWTIGFSIYLVGQVLNFVAMAWAPQAVLGALGASSLVFLALLAWTLLGERMERLELCALVFTTVGVIMVILAVPEAAAVDHTSANAIAGNLGEVEFVTTAVGFAAVLCVFWGSIAICMPSFTAARGMFWIVLTGVLAGYTVTLWKCVSMLLFNTPHTWTHWQFYFIALLAAAFCVVQIHTLNIALATCAAKAVVPMTFALGVLIQIMNAQVAFEELEAMQRFAVFWIGVVLVLASMACIVQIQLSSEEEGEEDIAFAESGAAKDDRGREVGPQIRRAQSFSGTGLSPITKDRKGRRHSSYFGIRDESACRGHIFPIGGSGLVVMT